MDMIKHSQSTQSNKLAIALQNLKKEVRHKAFLYKFDRECFTCIKKHFSTATAFFLQNALQVF